MNTFKPGTCFPNLQLPWLTLLNTAKQVVATTCSVTLNARKHGRRLWVQAHRPAEADRGPPLQAEGPICRLRVKERRGASGRYTWRQNDERASESKTE
eukprot:45754-Eustigmatos_ZCMA.PRE.1